VTSYKIPGTVLTEKGWNCPGFSCRSTWTLGMLIPEGL